MFSKESIDFFRITRCSSTFCHTDFSFGTETSCSDFSDCWPFFNFDGRTTRSLHYVIPNGIVYARCYSVSYVWETLYKASHYHVSSFTCDFCYVDLVLEDRRTRSGCEVYYIWTCLNCSFFNVWTFWKSNLTHLYGQTTIQDSYEDCCRVHWPLLGLYGLSR